MKSDKFHVCRVAAASLLLFPLAAGPGAAQQVPMAPPAVGVVAVTRQPVTRSSEYIGRIRATDRVNLVARVAAYLDERLFVEGAEIRKGDLLYRLEQAPFQADVRAKEATVAQFKAQLQNAEITLARARALLRSPAGQQSAVDTAMASELALQAQVLGAEAQLQQARINLGYTEIRAPIDGKIGRSMVSIGNYVTAGTGTLASIVSQDPMYVVFPVATRIVLELRRRAAGNPDSIVVKLRLPDGRLYGPAGKLDFIDNTVAGTTDTMILRAVIPNPLLKDREGDARARELVDGELVTVVLEDAQPVDTLTIPRAAVLTDQSGDYVYVVGDDDKAQQRHVQLGQSSPTTASVTNGLKEGENVIVEGIQRVLPGRAVSPGPAGGQMRSPAPGTSPSRAAGGRG